MLRNELDRALVLGLGERQLRAGLGEACGGLVALGLVGARIDDEQHVALLDLTALP